MKNKSTPLTDEHLKALQPMQEAVTDDFFYTRLKARMERAMQEDKAGEGWAFPLKPVWVIGTMVLLLAVNGFMLSQEYRQKNDTANGQENGIQQFASSYDQVISSSY